MSGSTGANLPVRIQAEGTAQAEAQFNSVAQAGQRAMQRVQQATDQAGASGGRFGYVMGQAGFQIQDFAVQVQGGTSALTALSQQGSQLLGAFGTGGAIAGAVLTVGILALNLFRAGEAADALAEAQKRLDTATSAANDLFETQIERVQRLEQAARRAVIATSALAAQSLRDQQAARAERLAALQPSVDQVREARALAGDDTFIPENIRRRVAEYNRLQEELSRGAEQIEELDRRMANAMTAPTGAQLDADAEGGGKPQSRAAARESLDVLQALRTAREEAIVGLDAYNQRLNLEAAGMERASGLLRQYESDMQALRAAVNNKVISETEFSDAVARSSERLAEQIDALGERSRSVDTMGRELGMTFSSAFEDAILKGQRFSEVLQGIAQDIARIVVRQTITAPLGNAVSELVKGIDFSSFIPGRAIGGPVMAGSPYIVGERGPELFVPGASGSIVPNHAMGGVTFAPTYNIDARGADASMVPRLRAEMAAIAQASLAQLIDQVQRGGSTSRVFGRRG